MGDKVPEFNGQLFTRDKSVIFRGVGFSFDLSSRASIVLVRIGLGIVADGRSIVFSLRRNTKVINPAAILKTIC